MSIVPVRGSSAALPPAESQSCLFAAALQQALPSPPARDTGQNRLQKLSYALQLSSNPAVLNEIAGARASGLSWSCRSPDGVHLATLTADGYNLLVSTGNSPALRVQLPGARPVLSGRACFAPGEPDALTRQLFDGPRIIIPGSVDRRLRHEYFSEECIIRLAGAPAGSTLQLSHNINASALMLLSSCPALFTGTNLVTLKSNEAGLKWVSLDRYNVRDDAPPGTGLRAFGYMVHAAQEAGFSHIETIAVAGGTPVRNGYYTWPRFGFNAALDEHPDDLLTVMSTPAGRDWWRENGATVNARFDLAPNSRSNAVLNTYLQERGVAL